ncbi:hypothetical protein NJB1907f44_20350, partial [Mycobacterium marinum]
MGRHPGKAAALGDCCTATAVAGRRAQT